MKTWRRLFSVAVFKEHPRWATVGVIALLALLGYALIPAATLYDQISFSQAFYDRQGKLLRLTLADDDHYRLFTPLENVAPEMVEGTLLYEDRYFHVHPGVNPVALSKAFWDSYITKKRVRGASTISMQLARIRFDIDSRSVTGKLKQIARAIQLERHYEKNQILEAYLNLAPYGRNIEGIGAASLIYFDKAPDRLSLPEALALSVVPQNPTSRYPGNNISYKNLESARARLFSQWQDKYPASQSLSETFELPLSVRTPEQLPFHAPHFVNAILSDVNEPLRAAHRTTIDLQLQHQLERDLTSYVARKEALGIRNASAMLVNFQTMQVEALIGSANFFNDAIAGQVNGTRAKRSPGSAQKPFIYALAIDQGLIHPNSLMKDAPQRFGIYAPDNFDKTFVGPVMAQDALISSRNVPAVQLLMSLKSPDFYDLLLKADINELKEQEFYGLALALGGNELSMTELVQLYAMLANRGVYQTIQTGVSSLKGSATSAGKRLLSPEASFLTLDMLSHHTAPSNMLKPDVVAWKTGTSYGFRDAWAIGVFDHHVLAVWVGNFDNESNPSLVGRSAAGPLLFEMIQSLHAIRGRFDGHTWMTSDGLNVRRVEVCEPTGDLPGRHCPRTKDAWFIPGVSPIKVSNVHQAIPIDIATGKRACKWHAETTELKVYEFWPSDVARLFRLAGAPRRSPPPYLNDCEIETKASAGVAPKITSPQKKLTYHIREHNLQSERVPFEAISGADARLIHWFVDDRYIGKANAGQTYFWPPSLGEFTVRAVDDLGRAAATSLRVRLVQ